MSQPVSVDRRGGVAAVLLNRPGRLNALDLETVLGLKQQLQELAADRGVAAIIIGGHGKAFCAGGDLAWAARYDGGTAAALHVLSGEFHEVILTIREIDRPVIGAMNGVAAGGGFSLALACDFRIMNRAATIRHAYAGVGLSMDGGASFTLPRLIGEGRALEIAAFDAPMAADRALSMGLVTETTDGDAVEAAFAMAENLSKRSLAAFGASKRLINASFHSQLAQQLTREREAIVQCAAGVEGREGVDAFVEKRLPDFAAARSVVS